MAFRPSGRSVGGVTRIKRDNYGKTWHTRTKAVTLRDQTCVQCQLEGRSSTGPLHKHHIIPLSRGGTTTSANLMLLCEEHHQQRHRHSVKR